ncbi:MAG: GTPase Era [Rhodospirillales bacterium]|nr:GTPase Era [Rhodospirillales bacterium]
MGESLTRCGFVAVVGAPNVGKSTLINRLVGTKVSIVSPKVQTTRTRVLGISLQGNSQVVFIDTPGIFEPRRRLDRAMVAAAWSGAQDADMTVLLVDSARGIDKDTRAILDRLKEQEHRPLLLALNKIDLVKKQDLLALSHSLNADGLFSETFMISAATGDGLPELMSFLTSSVPEGPWHFPEDQVSDMPQRMLAAEITREQIFRQLHQELPYAATVETESWEDKDDGSIKINQVIYVERPGHKGIFLGNKGSRIKSLGEASRKELEEIFETRVHLFLFVKVREKWGDDPDRYRDWGLDYNA